MSETRKPQTQAKVDTVYVTAKILADSDQRLNSAQVSEAIKQQVQQVHGS